MPRKRNNTAKQTDYYSSASNRAFTAAVVRLLRLRAKVPTYPARPGEEEISGADALERLREIAAQGPAEPAPATATGKQASLDCASQAQS